MKSLTLLLLLLYFAKAIISDISVRSVILLLPGFYGNFSVFIPSNACKYAKKHRLPRDKGFRKTMYVRFERKRKIFVTYVYCLHYSAAIL